MDNSHPLSTLMVVQSLQVDKDPFRPKEDDDDIFGPKVHYLSANGVILYLANCNRHDTAFAVNFLARLSAFLTRRHWNGVKHILHYLQGTKDLSLFYARD